MNRAVSIAVLACALLGCGGDEPPAEPGDRPRGGDDGHADAGSPGAPAEPGSELGFYATALPILQARCQSCHVPGGAGPFALESYDDVAAVAGLLRAAVVERRMPPLPADDRECRQLSDTRTMLEQEREALVAWLDAGLPLDDPSAAPDEPLPAQTSAHEQPLGEATSSADFGMSYTSQSAELDDYRCLIVDPSWSETHHLRAIGVTPGNPAIVHHVIVFAQLAAQQDAVDQLDAGDDGPGYTCFGGAGFTGAMAVGGYVPGAPTRGFAGGVTASLPAGTRFVAQMHYNFIAAAGEDNTRLDFWEVDAPSDVQGSRVVLVHRGFRIPAGDPAYTVTAESPILDAEPTSMTALGPLQGRPGLAWGASGHMHTRGKSIRIDLLRADGGEECLLDIPHWDFNWQGQYRFMEPLELVAGDRLRMTCTWDNSAGNQPIIDGQPIAPTDITWGEGTLDEMCLGGVQMTRTP